MHIYNLPNILQHYPFQFYSCSAACVFTAVIIYYDYYTNDFFFNLHNSDPYATSVPRFSS